MAATIQDIADRAGLSKQAVSQVLNCRGRIGADAKARILAAAHSLGYRPNAAARATAAGRFGNIALLMSATARRSTMPATLLNSIYDALAINGLHLTLAKLSDEAVTDDAVIPRILREWSADGLLVNYHKDIPTGMERVVEESGRPAIWMNCDLSHDCIRPDDFDAGRRITQHFIEQGHTRIAYVDLHCGFGRDPQEHYSQYERLEGYAAAMIDNGRQPRRIDFAGRAWRNKATLEFWSDPQDTWLAESDRPTAVVTYAEPDAVAIMLAAQKLHIPLPDGLAIGTFGSGPMSIHGLRVPSMVLPYDALGEQAVRLLIARMNLPGERLATVKVPFEFQINPQSTGGTEPSVIS